MTDHDKAIVDNFLHRDRIKQLREMLNDVETDPKIKLPEKTVIIDWIWRYARAHDCAKELQHILVVQE